MLALRARAGTRAHGPHLALAKGFFYGLASSDDDDDDDGDADDVAADDDSHICIE